MVNITRFDPLEDAFENEIVAPYPRRHRGAKVGMVECPLTSRGSDKLKVTTVGFDLAKNVIQVHGVMSEAKRC